MKYPIILPAALLAAALAVTGCGRGHTAATAQEPTESGVQAPTAQKFRHVLHKAGTRGESRASWLLSKHTFTFNDYYDPDRMNFGALRVLNDDDIAPASKFPFHGHKDMEIITIPLHGAVWHKDDMGNSGVISTGDVQIMSAGKGVMHSEANNSTTDTLRLLQIWVLPDRGGVKPRYQQINGILANQKQNTVKKFVAPNDSSAIFLYQNAVFSMGELDKAQKHTYKPAFAGNGVYAFVIEGSAKVNGIALERRDGIGIWDTDQLQIEATDKLKILLMDVPMID